MATLTDIARDMTQKARSRGWARYDLPRGLDLYLTCCGGQMALHLSRPATMPSEEEVKICRQAFGVPEDAARQDNSHSVALRWPSAESPGRGQG